MTIPQSTKIDMSHACRLKFSYILLIAFGVVNQEPEALGALDMWAGEGAEWGLLVRAG